MEAARETARDVRAQQPNTGPGSCGTVIQSSFEPIASPAPVMCRILRSELRIIELGIAPAPKEFKVYDLTHGDITRSSIYFVSSKVLLREKKWEAGG